MTPFLKNKFGIITHYLPRYSLRRPCISAEPIRFIVAHDTGNPGSTAANNVTYYERSCNETEASAHIFVDDKEIIECIPFLTGTPEKAWHVLYNTPIDNALFSANANDAAGGIELCYGGNIDILEAYKKYVWVIAYACWLYQLTPQQHITGHYILDPSRKVDPKNAFSLLGKTFEQFLHDVTIEFNLCTSTQEEDPPLLDKGVAETIINTWIVPSWHQQSSDQEQQAYLHWLANELRKAAGIPLE